MMMQSINQYAHQRFPRWQALLVLCAVVLLLAGCALQPIVAGPSQQLPATPAHPAPVLAIAPTSGAAGTQITASSAGWQPSEVVSLEVAVIRAGAGVTTTITTAAADNDGRINATFFLPLTVSESDLPEVAIVARSLTTQEKALASFTVSKEMATITPTLTVATPTATSPAATATPTTAATSATNAIAHVTSGGLNMRSGPSTAYGILRSLSRNAEMTVLGQSSDSAWLYARLSDGLLGWVARSFTDFTRTAPVVQAPPLPPAPTAAPTLTPTYTPVPTINDWRGEYYANKALLNSPVIVRNDTNLDFDWGYGSPGSGIAGDNFSARWTRSLYFDAGTYRFNVLTDDGARVWLDGNLIIDQWHDGSATTYSSDQGLGAGNHSLRVEYYENTGTARLRFWWDRIDNTPTDFPDWKGRYWSNRKLDGDADVERNDRKIDFNWGNDSPDDRLPDNNFSARWTREIDFKRGLYRFYARADDGIRVWIDDDRVIDEWHDNDYDNLYTFDRFLDDDHDLKVEYFEHNGGARVRFWWERIGDQPTATPTLTATPVPLTNTPTNTPTPLPPTLTPTPTRNANANASPSSGGANTRVTVTGSGFPANVAVHAYLGGLVEASALSAAKPQPYANATTDSKGAYSLSFVLPDKWPNGTPIEAGQVVILVATDNFTVQASATFDYRLPQPTKAPKPYADVEPNKGGAQTQVTVSGGGFPANTPLNVHLAGVAGVSAAAANPQVYATTTSDNNGNFNVAFTLPDKWPDGQPLTNGKLVVLVATGDLGTVASATFDYFVAAPNPSIRINPTSGGATTQVTASGGGFPANVAVNLHLGTLDEQIGKGGAKAYASGKSDANGNYSLTFSVPAQWPNGDPIATDKILVLVATEDFSVQVSTVFNFVLPPPTATNTPVPPPTPTNTPVPPPTATNTPVTPPTATPQPSINLSPTAGSGNQSVTVSGSGFPAGATLNVHLARPDHSGSPDAANFASTTTDGNGNFALSVVIPQKWPNGDAIATGPIVVMVATNDFSVQASAVFNFTAAAAAEAPPAPDTPTPEAPPTEPITPTVPVTNTNG